MKRKKSQLSFSGKSQSFSESEDQVKDETNIFVSGSFVKINEYKQNKIQFKKENNTFPLFLENEESIKLAKDGFWKHENTKFSISRAY